MRSRCTAPIASIVATWLGTLCAPHAAAGQPKVTTVKAALNAEARANGDVSAAFTLTPTLAVYERLKRNFPNPYLLVLAIVCLGMAAAAIFAGGLIGRGAPGAAPPVQELPGPQGKPLEAPRQEDAEEPPAQAGDRADA